MQYLNDISGRFLTYFIATCYELKLSIVGHSVSLLSWAETSIGTFFTLLCSDVVETVASQQGEILS